MSNDADAERVAELARGVVADHDPKGTGPGVSRRLLRRRPVVGAFPRRPRRARGVSRSAGCRRPHPAGRGWTGATRAQSDGLWHGRPDDPRARADRGREAAMAAPPCHHRGPLVSAVSEPGSPGNIKRTSITSAPPPTPYCWVVPRSTGIGWPRWCSGPAGMRQPGMPKRRVVSATPGLVDVPLTVKRSRRMGSVRVQGGRRVHALRCFG